MRLLGFLVVGALAAWGAEVPAGTVLSVRLTSDVSTATVAVGQPVTGLTVSPVVSGGAVVIPPHTPVAGQVKSVLSAAKSDRRQARLIIAFDKLTIGGVTLPLHAELSDVDNARETVDEHGAIIGIVPRDTFEGLAERGIGKLEQNQQYSQLAEILQAAKQVLVKPVDPEITLTAGTDVGVRLTKELNVKAPPSYAGPSAFPHLDQINQMVEVLPYLTYAVQPPEPSDVTNVLLIGSQQAVTAAFNEAGWSPAQELSQQSKFEVARALIESRGYKEAPVSVLLLDRRAPTIVFQKSFDTFAMRHHIRLWRMPGTFNGIPVWSCSATHDNGIDLSQDTFTFVHRVETNIDRERSKVIDDLVFTGRVNGLALVDRPNVSRSFRNATGDAIVTDGRIAVLGLRD